MPFSVERLTDAPIITVTLTGSVDADTIAQADLQVIRLLGEYPVNTALIFDTTQATSSFKQILEILQSTSRRNARNTAKMPFVVLPAFVGTDLMVKLYVDAARQQQFGGQQLPLFTSRADGIAAMTVAVANLSEHQPNT